ncbi:unnamed protein product [Nesidiocoris tenuis]|uniref:Uncharacterized protein n=1 Tax=Nesidiocoris tenuis TaxID=355587 RepID=A0A6H5H8Y9_9HEMI|nr:unnamed protein product [Nesidiocoris tenuis]
MQLVSTTQIRIKILPAQPIGLPRNEIADRTEHVVNYRKKIRKFVTTNANRRNNGNRLRLGRNARSQDVISNLPNANEIMVKKLPTEGNELTYCRTSENYIPPEIEISVSIHVIDMFLPPVARAPSVLYS